MEEIKNLLDKINNIYKQYKNVYVSELLPDIKWFKQNERMIAQRMGGIKRVKYRIHPYWKKLAILERTRVPVLGADVEVKSSREFRRKYYPKLMRLVGDVNDRQFVARVKYRIRGGAFITLESVDDVEEVFSDLADYVMGYRRRWMGNVERDHLTLVRQIKQNNIANLKEAKAVRNDPTKEAEVRADEKQMVKTDNERRRDIEDKQKDKKQSKYKGFKQYILLSHQLIGLKMRIYEDVFREYIGLFKYLKKQL